jgi:hypothetical protein
LGSLPQTVYPRHKIKVVPPPEEDDTEHYEVEKILKHRSAASSKLLDYFVKWKNHPQSENSWVKESNFNTMEIINDYWKNLGTTLKPIYMFKITSYKFMLVSLFLLLLRCTSGSAQIVIT